MRMDINAILNRVMRLARLDTTVFDEVRDDERELIPAIVIVAVSALLAGIGAWLWLLFVKPDGTDLDFGNVFLKIIVIGTIFAAVLWGVWVAVTYVVLVQFYKEQTDLMSLLRTMGYAAFPFSLSLLMFIPGLSFGIALAAVVLWFVMSTYAVQAASNAQSDRVVMANAIGFIVFAVVMALIARESGLTTGVFVNSESRAIGEGEYYKVDLGGLEDLIR
jgi:hypothetical protein